MRRTAAQLTVAASLLVLLGVIGTLQYRWLGEVSNAERDRLRSSLRSRAADFTRDFDREITRTYMAFRATPDLPGDNPAAALSDAYARAQQDSAVGGLIQSVYYLEATGARAFGLTRLDPAARTLTPVEWPPQLEALRRRAERVAGLAPGMPPLLLGDLIDARTPALVVSLPTMKRIASGERIAILHDPQALARGVILLLDADTLQRRLIDALVARHFGTPEQSEYFVSVQSRDATPQLVFASNPGIGLTAANADLATGMFDLRLDEMMPMDVAVPPPPGLSAEQIKTMKDRVAITIVRRAATADRSATSAGDGSGAWQVLIRSKDGSLDAVVARSRRRNLAIGLGVLGLLAASFVFLVGSAQRQQRLARQQMEFVAAVSHELRTPLAVIRSAGDNLADGVVADGEQVKKYGALIGKEGRRLSEMVERVMEYAGISQSASAPTLREVDLTRIVGAAVEGIQTDARDREVTVALSAEREIPPLSGDETALRSAVQNVVGNAVKYSAAGATVQVTLARDRDRVTLTVADRGLGIDASDLPHIFKPFYRGRRAVEAQIRGTGIGLSVVRHVVEGHHGNVHVDSRAGEGTTVTISLPAAPRREGLVGDAAPRAAT